MWFPYLYKNSIFAKRRPDGRFRWDAFYLYNKKFTGGRSYAYADFSTVLIKKSKMKVTNSGRIYPCRNHGQCRISCSKPHMCRHNSRLCGHNRSTHIHRESACRLRCSLLRCRQGSRYSILRCQWYPNPWWMNFPDNRGARDDRGHGRKPAL